MHDLLTFVLSDPPEDDDDVSRRYRERYLSTIEMHMPGLMPENFAEDASTEAQIKARVVKLRKQYDVLRSVMGDIETAFEGLHERLDKIREKRPPREIETKETPADHRPEGLPDAPVRPRKKAEESTG
jgi:hypothetical protein